MLPPDWAFYVIAAPLGILAAIVAAAFAFLVVAGSVMYRRRDRERIRELVPDVDPTDPPPIPGALLDDLALPPTHTEPTWRKP